MHQIFWGMLMLEKVKAASLTFFLNKMRSTFFKSQKPSSRAPKNSQENIENMAGKSD
jgi:hypothetical protein